MDGLRQVHAGKTHIPAEVAAKLAERIRQPSLTERELEVLKLLAAGKSNPEIGAELFISEGTVKAHVYSILKKLGVSSRSEAMAVALKRGLVHTEGR